ncbi:hypothetical protein HNV12_13585 [Methanococcoides sp. SA1]|nr:hypothetical protein [Methanococcoides sp. SA1]
MTNDKATKTKTKIFGGYQPIEKGYQAQNTGTIDKSNPPKQGSGVPAKKNNSK